MSDGILVGAIALGIASQGFFSGSEIALVSADRLRLQADAERGQRAAALALRMLERPVWALGTCLVGTNLSVIAVATTTVVLLSRHLALPGALLGLLVVPLTLTFGEMLPKAIYQHHADRLVRVVVFPLRAISTFFAPVLRVLEAIHRVLGGAEETRLPAVTRQELRLLLEHARSADLTPANQQMIRRVFEFSEAVTEDVMVPLVEVIALPETATISEAARVVARSGHSRIPIYRERVDDIVGFVLHRDLLDVGDWSAPVSTVLRPILYVPESKPADELLLEMQRRHQRLAAVVDEYGGAVGIVTVEDILEEIVGEIEDESDPRRPLVRRVGPGEWLVSGRAEIEQVRALTGIGVPDGDYETIAGLVLERKGHVPRPGETVVLEGCTVEVTRASERAILEVRVRRR